MKKLMLAQIVLLAGSLGTLMAQTTTGTFGGTISDSSGGRVPQANVSAVNADTGQKYSTSTSAAGDYIIVQVPPGNYVVSVEAPGFKTLTRTGLKLEVDAKITLNLTLEVGSVSESVAVTGETPLLRTQDAQVGEVIDSKMIQNVPQLDRNPLDLLRLTGDISGSTGTAGAGDTRINGGRAQGLDVLVDGNTILSGKGHSIPASAPPSMEQVDEFKVITNGISAEYGRVSGGLLEVATKSGTNQIHGELFEYFRNQLLNANTWEQNWSAPYVAGQKAPRTQFHQNDYGFQVGGPVVLPKIYKGTNKTFFFVNWEGQNYRQAAVGRLGMAATQAERNGDLTGLLFQGVGPMMWDPLGEIGKNASGQLIKLTPLGGNGMIVPKSRIDPLAQLIMSYMPQQNRTPTPGYSQQNAYYGQQAYNWNDKRWEVRMDHNFTDNSRATLRFNRDYYNDQHTQWYDALSPADGDIRPGSIQGSLGWTWTATPTTIVEVRGAVMHNPNLRNPTWNIPNQSSWPIDPLMKQLTRDNPADLNYRVWSANQLGWGSSVGNQDLVFQSLDSATNYSAVASVTKIWGKHTIKTGVESRRFFDNHWEDLFGSVDYGGSGGNAVGQNNSISNMWLTPNWWANTWGSFLLGIPDSASKQSTLNLANAQNYYAAYIQDDIKVTSKFTANVGLRWDMESPMTERHNDLTEWDPNRPSAYTLPASYSWNNALTQAGLTPAQIAQVPTPSWVKNGKFPNGYACFAATPECRSRLQAHYHPLQFAPRLGAAYQLNSKTVLRASWGLMYLSSTGDYWNGWVVDASHAASNSTDRDPVTGNVAHNNQSMFYPNQYVPFAPNTPYLNYNIGSGYEGAGTSTYVHPPHEYDWNFNIQREIPWKILVEAGYNGNHGGELISSEPNSPFPANLVQPQYSKLFSTMVANPLAGQINPAGLNSNPTVPLGILMLSNPVNGGLTIYGENVGRSNYNAGTLKLRKQFSQGVTFLLTYTYSKLLDDVGNVTNGGGGGSKPFQSFQDINNLYGYSPQDMTHRFTFYHDVQFPFGPGRKFLGNPTSIGGKILNGFIGGWEYAGIWIYRSGTPLNFVPQVTNVSQYSGVDSLWGSITGNMAQITPSNYQGDNQVLSSGLNNPASMTVRRFDSSRFTQPVDMTPGNVPPIYPWIRNPGAATYDGSLMKNFPLFREGMYMQFRIEAQNMFNIRGLGNYDTAVGDPNFGLITSSAQNPRNMQISARFFF